MERLRIEQENQSAIKDEDKYEPEFCLDDDDSNDAKPHFKESNRYIWFTSKLLPIPTHDIVLYT